MNPVSPHFAAAYLKPCINQNRATWLGKEGPVNAFVVCQNNRPDADFYKLSNILPEATEDINLLMVTDQDKADLARITNGKPEISANNPSDQQQHRLLQTWLSQNFKWQSGRTQPLSIEKIPPPTLFECQRQAKVSG